MLTPLSTSRIRLNSQWNSMLLSTPRLKQTEQSCFQIGKFAGSGEKT